MSKKEKNMNLSINGFQNTCQINKINNAPAFKGVLTYERENGTSHTIDARFIGSITPRKNGDGAQISFNEHSAQPFDEYGHRVEVDSVKIPYEKIVQFYARALGTNTHVTVKPDFY